MCDPSTGIRLQLRFTVLGILILLLASLTAYSQTPTSIAVTPLNPVAKVGDLQQFSAISGDGATFPLSQVSALAGGGNHTCALMPNGTVECWGANSYGELGNGTYADSPTPTVVSGLSGVTALASGWSHTCALLADGTVKCWGAAYPNGTDRTLNTPLTVAGLTGVSAITAGFMHTCALLQDGTVKCWGLNDNGPLGNGTTVDSTTPVTVSGLSNVTSLVAGSNHSCALLSDGSAKCWGSNVNGQLGDGTKTDSSTPVFVSGLSGAGIKIAAGYGNTCALLSNGTLNCWGDNVWGELGNADGGESLTPAPVPGISGVINVEVGVFRVCTLLSNGTVQCWGYNTDGEVGNGTTSLSVTTPSTVTGLSGVTAISAGGYHTCALVGDGTVQCWGYGTQGSLGNGSATNSSFPVTVVAGTGGSELPSRGVKQVASGLYHQCALLGDGTLDCWGNNWGGQLWQTPANNANTPLVIGGIINVRSLSAGAYHNCALLSNGTVQCWGTNYSGLLGDGSYSNSSTPVSVTGLSDVSAVAAGEYHSCALLSNGTVQCWGSNMYGGLGNGSFGTDSPLPVQVSGLPGATAVVAGTFHSCALLADGTVRCWGWNTYGELGNGSSENSNIPVQVTGLSGVVSIVAGSEYTCALLANGTVKCWGVLGASSTPVDMGLSNVKKIASGYTHVCALLRDGTVQCWGGNTYGQLGDGTTTTSLSPVTVAGLTGVNAISAGYYHTCALLANGTMKCWGGNYYGQLGNGTNADSTAPVPTVPLANAVAWTSSDPAVAAIDPMTGIATAVGAGTATISANYGSLNASTTLTVGTPPSISLIPVATFVEGYSGASLTVTATGTPTPTLSMSGTLPTGLTFDPATGILGGTPAVGTMGDYTVTFTASNGMAPDATLNYAFRVKAYSTLDWPWAFRTLEITYGSAIVGDATATYQGQPIAGTFVYTPIAGTILGVGSGQQIQVDFYPSDSDRYLYSGFVGHIDVIPAPSNVTLNCPASVVYNNQPQTPCTATATGAGGLSVPVTVTYNNNSAPGTATASATYGGDANHTGSNASTTFVITGSLGKAATPTFSPGFGTFTAPKQVTISDATPGVTIYYTTDGSMPTTTSPNQCASPCSVTVAKTGMIAALAAGGSYSASAIASASYVVVAATPVITPGFGTFTAPKQVSITDTSAGVTIYYTTDGSIPTTSSPNQCTSPCTLTVSTTGSVKAIAAGGNYGVSAVASASYVIVAATPVITPGYGTFTGPKQVTITDATAGVTIYYTTDSSIPTTASPNQCTSPCTLTVSTTGSVKAIAAGGNYGASAVASASYVMVAATPAITPGYGTFTGPKQVTITDATAGVTIYYTTDGTNPTTSSSNQCTSPCTLTLTTSGTVKAMAAGGGYNASSVASASLVIK